MSSTSTPTTDIAPSAPQGNDTPPKPKRAHTPQVTCALCKNRYRNLSRHVNGTHGVTLVQYWRVFGHPTPEHPTSVASPSHTSSSASPSISGVPGHLVRQLAARCAESDEFLDRLASDVGVHLLGSGLRTALAASLGALLQTRMVLAGDAAALLARIDTELAEPWRTQAGGEMGEPTATRDLVAMHQAASAQLNSATDTTLRAMKLAIDERRGQTGEAAGDAPLDRYRGTRDALPLPDDIGPQERGIMLALMERLAQGARASKQVIDADRARVIVPLAPTDSTDAHTF